MSDEEHIDATHLLMDSDIENILLGTYRGDMSAYEISENYGIPIATCFKKVKQLKKMGLLEVSRIEHSSGYKKIEYYSANLENAYVYYDSGRLKVRFKVVMQMANDFRKRYEYFTAREAEKAEVVI